MDRSSPKAGATGFAVGASVAASLIAVASFVVVNLDYDGEGSGSVAAGGEPVAVELSEFALDPDPITVPEGGSLSLSNTGSMVHNVEVLDQSFRSPDVAAGASGSLDLSGLAAGSYTIFCNIPGHRQSGMEATLVVGAAGAATETAAGGHEGHGAAFDWAAADEAMVANTDEYVQAVVDSLSREGGVPAGVATEGRGNEVLEPTIGADGAKEFELTASIIDWEVEPGKVVEAWAYNEQLPGPQIKVEPGDLVRVTLHNELPAATDIHWHGISTPFRTDGVAPITQPMVEPGESYTYEFQAPERPELGMYHPHNHGQVAVVNGMFAVFQVGDLPLPAGGTIGGIEVPAGIVPAQEIPMVVNDAGTVGLSLNGKAFPATAPIVTRVGDWTLLHYYNEGLTAHPMHLHHMPQLVVAKDGFPLDAPYWADTVNVAPGERYSVLVHTDEDDVDLADPADPGPGIWAFHCHILTHAEDDEGLFGMVTAWVVLPA
jgi:manganese oxidase